LLKVSALKNWLNRACCQQIAKDGFDSVKQVYKIFVKKTCEVQKNAYVPSKNHQLLASKSKQIPQAIRTLLFAEF